MPHALTVTIPTNVNKYRIGRHTVEALEDKVLRLNGIHQGVHLEDIIGIVVGGGGGIVVVVCCSTCSTSTILDLR